MIDMRLFRKPDTAILMVCTANICRSPMAEGVLRQVLEQRGLNRKISVDSAGTHASQPGRSADARAQKVCKLEGVDLSKCRARQVREQDFMRFDHILAMDQRNHRWLLDNCPEACSVRVSLLGEWAEEMDLTEIPDPYYGNKASFEKVFEMLRTSIQGFMKQIAA
jgi:low molecular weight protein-tyrosine phosphatase